MPHRPLATLSSGTQPAKNWNEALPIGNCCLGAMVFGGIAEEHLQLNEDTVWAGEKRDRNNPAGAKAVPEVRRLLFAGKPHEAEVIADRDIIATPRRMPPYQTLGDLTIRFSGVTDAQDYRRELDISTAVARTTFQAGDAVFTREVFSSAVDQVIAMRLTCSQSKRISFTATLHREANAQSSTAGTDSIVMTGQAIVRDDHHSDERKTGVKFTAALVAHPEGGHVSSDNGALTVEGADFVTLLLTASTDFRPTPLATVTKPYAQLRAAHIADYQEYFQRVDLHLGEPPAGVPTDERLKRIAAGADDPHLASLYFQFGRYLLISSSRPGTMAATLQGIWNDCWRPPGTASTPSTSTPK